MAEVLFFIAALGAIAGAVGVIASRNPFYSVLSLVCHLLALAVLFLLLQAQFVAAAQVVVYAGAVMVLYVFVVAYVGGTQEMPSPTGRRARITGPLFAGALVVELFIAVLGSGLHAISTEGAGLPGDYGTPAQIGDLLLRQFLLVFKVASFLLLVAAVGAVMLARRRGGLPEDEERRVSVYDVLRPGEVGTMREAVGVPYHHVGPPTQEPPG
jgi:NADH:ubiquinone oxidoreductase subunit 6 (subunit J)